MREIRVNIEDVVSVPRENSFTGCLTSLGQHILSGAAGIVCDAKKGLFPWFNNGVRGRLLKPDGQWMEGKFFFRLYFLPDEPPKEPDPFK